jgi:hypothetical protein
MKIIGDKRIVGKEIINSATSFIIPAVDSSARYPFTA